MIKIADSIIFDRLDWYKKPEVYTQAKQRFAVLLTWLSKKNMLSDDGKALVGKEIPDDFLLYDGILTSSGVSFLSNNYENWLFSEGISDPVTTYTLDTPGKKLGKVLERLEKFDPEQPRDKGGRWAKLGGGSSSAFKKTKKKSEFRLKKELTDSVSKLYGGIPVTVAPDISHAVTQKIFKHTAELQKVAPVDKRNLTAINVRVGLETRATWDHGTKEVDIWVENKESVSKDYSEQERVQIAKAGMEENVKEIKRQIKNTARSIRSMAGEPEYQTNYGQNMLKMAKGDLFEYSQALQRYKKNLKLSGPEAIMSSFSTVFCLPSQAEGILVHEHMHVWHYGNQDTVGRAFGLSMGGQFRGNENGIADRLGTTEYSKTNWAECFAESAVAHFAGYGNKLPKEMKDFLDSKFKWNYDRVKKMGIRAILREIKKSNPNHYPAGSSKGGEFAPKGSGWGGFKTGDDITKEKSGASPKPEVKAFVKEAVKKVKETTKPKIRERIKEKKAKETVKAKVEKIKETIKEKPVSVKGNNRKSMIDDLKTLVGGTVTVDQKISDQMLETITTYAKELQQVVPMAKGTKSSIKITYIPEKSSPGAWYNGETNTIHIQCNESYLKHYENQDVGFEHRVDSAKFKAEHHLSELKSSVYNCKKRLESLGNEATPLDKTDLVNLEKARDNLEKILPTLSGKDLFVYGATTMGCLPTRISATLVHEYMHAWHENNKKLIEKELGLLIIYRSTDPRYAEFHRVPVDLLTSSYSKTIHAECFGEAAVAYFAGYGDVLPKPFQDFFKKHFNEPSKVKKSDIAKLWAEIKKAQERYPKGDKRGGKFAPKTKILDPVNAAKQKPKARTGTAVDKNKKQQIEPQPAPTSPLQGTPPPVGDAKPQGVFKNVKEAKKFITDIIAHKVMVQKGTTDQDIMITAETLQKLHSVAPLKRKMDSLTLSPKFDLTGEVEVDPDFYPGGKMKIQSNYENFKDFGDKESRCQRLQQAIFGDGKGKKGHYAEMGEELKGLVKDLQDVKKGTKDLSDFEFSPEEMRVRIKETAEAMRRIKELGGPGGVTDSQDAKTLEKFGNGDFRSFGQSTVVHEYGHVWHSQNSRISEKELGFGYDSDWLNDKNMKAYEKFTTTGYSRESLPEAFAEGFTLFMSGLGKTLHPEMNTFFEKHIGKGINISRSDRRKLKMSKALTFVEDILTDLQKSASAIGKMPNKMTDGENIKGGSSNDPGVANGVAKAKGGHPIGTMATKMRSGETATDATSTATVARIMNKIEKMTLPLKRKEGE